jgi:hypothetical protein
VQGKVLGTGPLAAGWEAVLAYCAVLVNRYTRGEMEGSLQPDMYSRTLARSRYSPSCPCCCCMCQLTLGGTGTVPV